MKIVPAFYCFRYLLNNTGRILLCTLFLYLLATGCTPVRQAAEKQIVPSSFKPQKDSLNLFDAARRRLVPVALYLPDKRTANKKVILLSHGYNENKPGANRSYSFIAENLAAKGYYIASIQHELPTDSLLPVTGVPQVVRRTNWERGVRNILFVLNELKRLHQELDYQHLILIGHSNGGDISMLFAQQYPSLADKVISLDNRRVALPRTAQPRIYSLRSSDQPADEGVLPTAEEQKKYGMKIIKLSNTIHNDMNDNATPEQRREINTYLLNFLNNE